jgi:hypothetical protein
VFLPLLRRTHTYGIEVALNDAAGAAFTLTGYDRDEGNTPWRVDVMIDGASAADLIDQLRAKARRDVGERSNITAGRGVTIDAATWAWLVEAAPEKSGSGLGGVSFWDSTLATSDGARAHFVDEVYLPSHLTAGRIPGAAAAFIGRAMKASKARSFQLDVDGAYYTATVQGPFLSFVVRGQIETAHGGLRAVWDMSDATAPLYGYAMRPKETIAALATAPAYQAPGDRRAVVLEPRPCDLAVYDTAGNGNKVALPCVDIMPARATARVHVRADYLAAALSGFGDARVTLVGGDNLDPVRLSGAGRRALVMPLRG